MDDGILYDPSQDPQAVQPPVSLPMLDQVNQQPQTPSLFGRFQDGLSQFGNQISNTIGNGVSSVRNAAVNDPGVFFAAASGIGKGTPMGDMASAIQSHYQLQDSIQQKKDAQAAMLKMQQNKLDEQARLNNSKIDSNTALALKNGTAKVTNMGNGFVSVIKPGDAAPTYVANQEYQDFVRGNIDTKGQYYMLGQGAKIDAMPKSPAQEKLEQDASDKATAANTTLNRWQSAKDMLQAQGAPELAGLPFVSRIAQILGTDSTAAYQVLSQLKVDEGFTNIPHGQGSMSNIEREMLMAPIPSMDASTDVWLNYINRRLPLIEASAAKHQAYSDQLSGQTTHGLATMQNAIQQMHPNAPVAAAQPAAAPAQAQPTQPTQAYPKGFNPPNAGIAPNNDARIEILKQELDHENSQPNTPAKQSNLAAIQRQLQSLGYKPQSLQPAPAAAPAAGGVPQFNSVADLQAAMKAGKLKSGDYFLDPKGMKRKVN